MTRIQLFTPDAPTSRQTQDGQTQPEIRRARTGAMLNPTRRERKGFGRGLRAVLSGRILGFVYSAVLVRSMLSHVHIGTNDYHRAVAFYGAVMEELGYVLKFREDDQCWAGWMEPGKPRPLLLVGRPFDGQPAVPGNGQMAALLARSRGAVDRSYARALDLGGYDEGAPAQRPWYHPDYYGAYVRDPDGNKLCFCCHEPA